MKWGHTKYENMVGKKVGRLTLLRKSDIKHKWIFKCDCGNEKAINIYNVFVEGSTTHSCGCLLRETAAQNFGDLVTHGLSDTLISNTWHSMVDRCYKPQHPGYAAYGARGVIVCRRLKESPHGIIKMIGDRPENKSLDRIKGEGSYTCGSCPECRRNKWPLNIRWATIVEQNRNKKTNVNIEIGGKVQCLSAWSEESGINSTTLRERYIRGLRGVELLAPTRIYTRKAA